MTFLLYWYLIGIVVGILGALYDHFRGIDLTLKTVLLTFVFSVAGPLFAILLLLVVAYNSKTIVVLKGRNK